MLPEAEFGAVLEFGVLGGGAGDAAKESCELAWGAEFAVIFGAQGEHLLPLFLKYRRRWRSAPPDGLGSATDIAGAARRGGDSEVASEKFSAAGAGLDVALDDANALELE